MRLSDILLPSAVALLDATLTWLDKTEEHFASNTDELEKLLSARLAPDMFPLAVQFRVIGFQLPQVLALLRGETFVSGTEEPSSWNEARARIVDTLALVRVIDKTAVDRGAERAIVLELPMGMVFDLNGEQLVRDWLLPQLYFHATIIYALLRHAGVPLGKRDFIPQMFTYLRSANSPGSE